MSLTHLALLGAAVSFCLGAFKLAEWFGYMALAGTLLGLFFCAAYVEVAKSKGGRK